MLKIYRSSAGSGKTFTLVKEYLRICLQSKDTQKFKHILAITFTNKACNEMKERIIHTLHDFASGTLKEETMFQLLQTEAKMKPEEIITFSGLMLNKILQDYSSFSISTIDSFIHKVIRSFAYELDIPHNFQVHLDKEELLDKIIETVLNEITEEDQSPIVQGLIDFAETKMEDGNGWNIESALRSFTKEMLQEDSLPYLERMKEIPQEQWNETLQKIRSTIHGFEKGINDLGNKIIQLILTQGLEEKDFYYGKSGIYSYFKRLQNFPAKDIELGSRGKQTMADDKWTSSKDTSVIARIDSIKSDLMQLIGEAQTLEEKKSSDYYLSVLILKNIYQLRVAEGISRALGKVKEEENILPIAEFQTIISKIVSEQDAPIIYERIGEKYDSILIDEFQDTSLLQFRNLLPLLENSQFKSEDALIVGDAKQSIYRFKGGEAQQLVDLPYIYGSNEIPILKEREVAINNYPTESKVLAQNFRSKQNIIAFNNDLYASLSQHDPLIAHIYQQHEQIVDEKKTGGFVSIESIEKGDDEEDLKAIRTLEIIRDCEAKNYQPSDIAILVRDNKRGAELAQFLIHQNYQIDTGDSLLFIQSKSVRLLIGVLQYLSDPFNKLFRYEMLFECGIADTHIYSANKKLLHCSLYDFDAAISEATAQSFSTFDCRQMSLLAICQRLAGIFQLPTEDTFMSSFMDLVQDYQQKNNDSLVDFITWWNEVKNKKSIQNNSHSNAIKIMTIHKSKGLQFPVVILPDVDWKIKQSKQNVWVEEVEGIDIHPILLSLNKSMEKTPFAAVYREEQTKSKLDTINLLYVATTRAEDRLYMLFTPHAIKEEINNADQFLQLYLTNKETADGIYTFGDKTMHKAVKKISASPQPNWNIAQSDQPHSYPIALKATREDFTNEEAVYGNLLHNLIARIATTHSTLQQHFNTKSYTEDEKVKLEKDIQYILEHPELEAYFSDNYERLVEFEIMDEQKKFHKPDLIAIKKGTKQIAIIDYKSGKEDARYHEQINLYASLLAQEQFEIEKKLIVYTQLKKIEEIA